MVTSLIRWSPFRQLQRSMRDEIDRFFEETAFHWPLMFGQSLQPAVNMYETEKNLILEVVVPGLQEKDLQIEASEDSVTIRCEKEAKREEEHDGYYRHEFSYGAFSRTIDLPVAVKGDQALAELKKGILTITLPKVEPSKPKAVRVPIVSG